MNLNFKVTSQNDKKPLNIFLKKCGISSSYIKKIKYYENGIKVNNKREHTNYIVHSGDMVSILVLFEDEHYSCEPQNIPIKVYYKSSYSMVVEKNAYMAMYKTALHKDNTLANAFSFYMQNLNKMLSFRPVYRLDRNTSGLVLVALNSLSVPFLSDNMEKEYIALVEGEMPDKSGIIETGIALEDNSIIKRCVSNKDIAKKSITIYETLFSTKELSLVKLILKTGRTHQIRVHMSHIGHPLLGDDLYGGSTNLINRHALHCYKINFTEPDGTVKEITSPLPHDMTKIINATMSVNILP